MKIDLHNPLLQITLIFLAGIGFGLFYSWKISPVTYVDADPSLLQSDFKDLYRQVIAASYAATKDLPRARARIGLLADVDPVGELSAQAQRMLAAGEPFDRVRLMAQLATDLTQGVTANPFTSTPFSQPVGTVLESTPLVEETLTQEPPPSFEGTLFVEGTPLSPIIQETPTPRSFSTPIPTTVLPFMLVGQETVCDLTLEEGLLQLILMDARRRQAAGVHIVITWPEGENDLFTGLKPELGNGYADFIMQADEVYSVRVVDGGSFVPNISAPLCSDPGGNQYLGGLLLTFQQP